jgi:hypothetical protein
MIQQKTAILELHYLPCIQYFTKICYHSTIWIEQHEHYIKRSYRNRCHIATTNGILRLSIPLEKGKNQQMPIRDVRISYDESWQKDHLKSIHTAYGNAPFFKDYIEELTLFYKKKYIYLFDFNLILLEWFINLYQIETTIRLTTEYGKETEGIIDYRNFILPQFKQATADHNFLPISYAQVFEERNGFIPNLSILDLLFCMGPQGILILESSINI